MQINDSHRHSFQTRTKAKTDKVYCGKRNKSGFVHKKPPTRKSAGDRVICCRDLFYKVFVEFRGNDRVAVRIDVQTIHRQFFPQISVCVRKQRIDIDVCAA